MNTYTAHLEVVAIYDDPPECTIKIYDDSDLAAHIAGHHDDLQPKWETSFTHSHSANNDSALLVSEAARLLRFISDWQLVGEAREMCNDWRLAIRAQRRELWTIDQVAEHLGTQPGSARGTLSRWGVKAHDYQPHPSSGRPQARYDAEEVRAAHASRPGQGARTDRHAT